MIGVDREGLRNSVDYPGNYPGEQHEQASIIGTHG
jgi:hypothetical protein